MKGNDCELAVRIGGAVFFVDGTGIDDHGDAHAGDGLCNQVRQALVSGRIEGGRFIANEFRLIETSHSTPTPLTNDATFLAVWSAANDRFYRADFNGVDWAKAKNEFLPQASAAQNRNELASVINRMLGLLNTSHTHFFTRDDVEYYHLADIFSTGLLGPDILPRFPAGVVQLEGIGLFARQIDGKWFVVGAPEGSPAALAGLRRGQQLLAVDGTPFDPVGSFRGKSGQEVSIEIQTAADEGSRKTVRATPIAIRPQQFLLKAMKNSVRIIDRNGHKIGYIRIWSYAGPQFQNALTEEIAAGKLAGADALIIDLRDGWGGADPEYLQLFNRQIPRLESVGRDGERSSFDPHWRKPAALLVNEGTRSGKELIAHGFRQAGIGPVVGTRTAGAVSAGTLIPIGSDAFLYLAVAGVEVDGKNLEGVGVEPDVSVPWDLPFASETDPQLQRAIELLCAK